MDPVIDLKRAILLALLALLPAGAPGADLFIRADSNLDRSIDISDAVHTLGCLFQGGACSTCADAADANDDGGIDLSDAIFTLNFSFQGGARPAPPGPSPGSDPTADDLGCQRGLGPGLTALEVLPATIALEEAGVVQLAVTGVYSDGSRADRTASSHGTAYLSLDPATASVSPEGRVEGLRAGDTSIRVSLLDVSIDVPCSVSAPGGLHPIVISEIMYHPISDDDRDEWVEIHNRGSRRVDLAGYRFSEGVEYTFPAGVGLDPGAFLVVAKDAANIKTRYGIQNVVGDFTLSLDDGGEELRLRDPAGREVDEVRFDDGGLWPRWADGWGSSLELIDLHGENDTPAAWEASDEASKSTFASFNITQTSTGASNELHLLLLHQGECLVDNLQVLSGGVNRLSNGAFLNGMTGWLAQGTHRRSDVTDDGELQIVATGRGDTSVNRVECDTTASIPAGQSISIRGSARWLRGSRFLLARLHGNTVAAPVTLQVPARNGTPGAANSTAIANRGPDIELVQHSPVLPSGSQQVTITALVRDVDGISRVEVSYRVNSGAISRVTMLDNGTAGDLDAGDSVYTARLPARAATSMVAFWISAVDGASTPATAFFPSDAPNRTCLYRTGEPNPASQLDRYHIWMPTETINLLRDGAKMSNELLDITFVLDNTEVFYNAKLRYRGSPFIRSAPPTDPVNGRYAYRIDFGEHQPLLNRDWPAKGRTEINLDNLEIGRDPTLQRERTAFEVCREIGLPYSEGAYVRVWINGADHQVYEDVEKNDQDYVDHWWPEDRDGYLHKIDDYFEFDDGGGFSNRNASLQNYGTRKEEYRWNWEKRSHDRDDDFSHMINLAAKMNAPDASYEASVDSTIDAEQWARTFALRKTIGDWDSFGYNRGKNMNSYFPAVEKRWKLINWDMDFLLGNGDGAFTALFGGIDGAVNRFLARPKYQRLYLRAFSDLVNGPFSNEYLDPILDQRYALLRAETSVSPPTGIKDYIRARRAFILNQIPGPELVITTNGGASFSTSQTSATIAGQAPLEVESFRLNGAPISPTRIGLGGWSFNRSLVLGQNTFLVEGFDAGAALVGSDSISILRVVPCVPSSVNPTGAPRGTTVQVTVTGTGFVPGSAARARLTSASGEPGFNALYVQAAGSFGGGAEAMDNAVSLLDDPGAAVDFLETRHTVISLRSNGGGEVFPNPARFPAPWNGDPSNFAARYSGFLNVPSAGRRTFGVNSDDGFRLTINDLNVAEWPQPRGPAVSLGDFNFPSAGSYPVVLEWYENGGGDIVQFFQQDATGGQALINGGSELTVTLEDVRSIQGTAVTVDSASTLRATFNLTGAEPGVWNLVITPEQGSNCELRASFTVQ